MAKLFKLTIPDEKHYCKPIRPITLPGTPGLQGVQGIPGVNAIIHSAQTDVAVTVGQVLYLKPSGTLEKAIASSYATSIVCGLAYTNATAFTSVNYEPDGVINLTDWTAITGATNLKPGAIYYLSPTVPGQLTDVAPTMSGVLVVNVGFALSSTRLEIEIESPILL